MKLAPTQLLHDLFRGAVEAVLPEKCLPHHLPPAPKGRTIVVGAGKAAASMARTVEEHWQAPLGGLVVTRYGHGVSCEHIEVIEAGHPVPDAQGQEAAERILALVQGLTEDDLVLCLISGGGSALLSLPAEGIDLEAKRAVNKALLKSGASISEMNCVRKHLSKVKGGRLASACAPAQVVSLLISDVPGNDPAAIASGPTVPDPSTVADAAEVVRKYGLRDPAMIHDYLSTEARETPKPGDRIFDRTQAVVTATAQDAMEAAAGIARRAGFEPLILGDLEGEASQVAVVHAGIAKQIAKHRQPMAPPCALISGGETTVTVRGNGRGGRNAEFLLSLAITLDGHPGIHALACDTDGIDGTEDNAGCILTPDSIARARELGMDPAACLEANDGYGFFSVIDDLILTGPTRTNVNDLRVVLIAEEAAAI